MEISKWCTHVQFLVIFVTLIGGWYALDAKSERLDAKIELQTARTDRLYEMCFDMFIGLAKEREKK